MYINVYIDINKNINTIINSTGGLTMTMNGLILRRETPPDYKTVENVTREAFWNHHGPGCEEHYLMHIMRDADAFIPELDLDRKSVV